MKLFILVMAIFTSLSSTLATDINTPVERNRKFKQYNEILEEQVDWAERSLDEYIEEELGCSKVRFNLKITKRSSLFTGYFDLNLTAKCTELFSDFSYVFYDGYDEDYTTLTISYVKNGQKFTKKFKSNAWW